MSYTKEWSSSRNQVYYHYKEEMIDGGGRDWRCRNRGHQKRHMWTSSSHHPHHYLSLSSVMATSKEPPPPRLLPFTTTTAFHPSVLTLLFLILLLLPSTIINASSNLPHSSPSFERCFPRTLSPSTVKIKYGSLKGLIVHLSSSSSSSSSTSSSSFSPRLAPVEVFLGVPYASPPTGALRFMPPVTPGHWRGTRLATRLAPSCPQPPLSVLANATSHAHYEWLKRMAARTANQSEDCLYLNIYTAIVDLDAISGKDVDAASLADDEKGKQWQGQKPFPFSPISPFPIFLVVIWLSIFERLIKCKLILMSTAHCSRNSRSSHSVKLCSAGLPFSVLLAFWFSSLVGQLLVDFLFHPFF